MKLTAPAGAHLTYCTNIHPGERWADVRHALQTFVLGVKAQVAPHVPFGVGLRLSALAAEELLAPDVMRELQEFLSSNGLYVFTLNGFPYGQFHHVRVKENVYRPDWLEDARLGYSNVLATVLARLLPESVNEGTISTSPGAFKARVKSREAVAEMADRMIRHVSVLDRLRSETGRKISIALEPEPCCFLETTAETIAFFQEHLFSASAIGRLSALTGRTHAQAEQALREHLGICFDACHLAIQFEDAGESLSALDRAGVRVVKAQLSSGLEVPLTAEAIAAVRPYAEGTYLHQVIEQRPSGLTRYVDLPEALAGVDEARNGGRWRVHFHVPVFAERLGVLGTTQRFLRDTLRSLRSSGTCQHLEVETYTWELVPRTLRENDVVTAISRELQWVQAQLA